MKKMERYISNVKLYRIRKNKYEYYFIVYNENGYSFKF